MILIALIYLIEKSGYDSHGIPSLRTVSIILIVSLSLIENSRYDSHDLPSLRAMGMIPMAFPH